MSYARSPLDVCSTNHGDQHRLSHELPPLLDDRLKKGRDYALLATTALLVFRCLDRFLRFTSSALARSAIVLLPR